MWRKALWMRSYSTHQLILRRVFYTGGPSNGNRFLSYTGYVTILSYRICKNLNLWIDGHHRGLKLENKTHDFYFVERRKDFRAFPVPRHMTSFSPRNEIASLPPRWVATASGMGPRPRKTLWCILRCWRDNFLSWRNAGESPWPPQRPLCHVVVHLLALLAARSSFGMANTASRLRR